jgi:hypothetical protein
VTDLDRIRALCLAQPRTVEKVSHGMPVFFIEKGRTFAWYADNHHGNGITAVLVKTSGADGQAMLVEAEPETFYRPAYLTPSGWIGLRLDTGDTDWARVAARIEQSWATAATPRLREQFGR